MFSTKNISPQQLSLFTSLVLSIPIGAGFYFLHPGWIALAAFAITFAGSFPGQTETMPIAVYYALENDPDAAIALSLVLLLVSVVVLVSLRDRWLRGGSVQ